jgi:3-isopropylmalate dehydratase small subunit
VRAFTTLESLVVPLDRANIDTDAILPKQFLASISRTGFGPYLFDEWRYLDHGEPGRDCRSRPLNPCCPLNHAKYQGAEILLTRENFGCGSSREHAVWALEGYGIRAILAASYADIFRDNCLRNGLLPVTLAPDAIDRLFTAVEAAPGLRLRIDLPSQTVTSPDGLHLVFDFDPYRKECLLQALDDIALTLQYADEIKRYEESRRRQEPWIFLY